VTSVPQTVICIGAVVLQADRVLLVRQASGHSLAGQWSIPWGRLEPGESPASAVLREISEEGGVEAELQGLLGVQELPSPWQGWVALLYCCRHVAGEPAGDGYETDAARYLTSEELDGWHEPIEPFSAWLVRRVLCGQSAALTAPSGNPFASCAGFFELSPPNT
jgi:8-oxo-dGTP diphosphatase